MIPNIQITDKGVQAPSREAVTDGLWNLLVAAFGPQLTRDDRTPQGQLVTSLTKVITDRDNATIELANNFDPRYAVGVYQEALGALYFIERKPAFPSSVTMTFYGLEGSVVPAGFICIDGANNEWQTTESAVIYQNGKTTANAICLTAGSINAASNTINVMKESVPGIDRADNESAAIAGSLEESRSEFETRRYESVAINGWGMVASVLGAVSALEGVADCYVIDNPSDSPKTVGITNYPMIRNSLLVSVAGGENQSIAKSILTKGGTGCAFVGNTDVVHLDYENYPSNPPEYTVSFLRPASVPVYIRIQVIDLSIIPYVKMEEAKQMIVDESRSGENKFRIGGKIYGGNFMCLLSGDTGVIKIEISRDRLNWKDSEEFGVDEFPETTVDKISAIEG